MRRTQIAMQLVLALLMVLALALAGCGGASKPTPAEGPEAAESGATAYPEPEEDLPASPETEAYPATESEPAEEPAEEAAAGDSAGDSEQITRGLDNLLSLAPLHMVSSFELKRDGEVASSGRVEADIDAQGNQHTFIYNEDGIVAEMVVVDNKLYIKIDADGDQYMAMDFEQDADSTFSFVAVYGGAYLLGYNDLRDAKKLGSEDVNGFACDKYEIKMNLASLGLSGLAADAGGAEFEYQGYAWIESSSKALVKAQVDWTSKEAGSEVVETFHSELETKPGTFDAIEAPANVMSVDTE